MQAQTATITNTTVSNRRKRTTIDGLGQLIKTESADSSGTVQSVADTIYGACAFSPIRTHIQRESDAALALQEFAGKAQDGSFDVQAFIPEAPIETLNKSVLDSLPGRMKHS